MGLTEREKEIALECIAKVDSKGWDFGVHKELVQFSALLLSRIREEQEAVAWIDEYNRLIRKKPIPIEGVTGTIFTPLFTTPPAAPKKDCDNCMALAMLRKSELGNLKTIRHLKDDYPELVEALRHLLHNAKASGCEMGLAIDVAEEAIASHTKRMKGE